MRRRVARLLICRLKRRAARSVVKILTASLVLFSIKLIANRWAWRWCLSKWAVIRRWATSLEPRALSRAHRHPRQLCERQPPTRHRHTDPVSGNTYQPYTYPNPPMREGREGGKSETTERNAAWNKQHLTEQKRTARAIRETPYNTSMRMTPRPPLTSIGLILT